MNTKWNEFCGLFRRYNPLISLITKQGGKAFSQNYWNLPLCFFVFILILSLKFGTPAALPETTIVPQNLLEWIIFSWPPMLFAFLAGLFLFFSVIFTSFYSSSDTTKKQISIFPLLWFLLAVSSLFGFKFCSCLDFAYLEFVHLLGLAAFAIAIFQISSLNDKNIKNYIIAAIVVGTIIAVIYGLYQYFVGFQETRNFVSQALTNQGIQLDADFKVRLMENLVYSTFSLSNSFGAHIILTIPLCLWFIYNTQSIRSVKIILTATLGIILLFTLYLTGSRAAILSLCSAIIILGFILPFKRKFKFLLLIFCVLGILIGFIGFHQKGFSSLIIRLDYFHAAVILLLKHIFMGSGWGEFFHQYSFLKLIPSDESPHMPHNFLLTMGSQSGIFSMLIAAIILLIPIIAIIKKTLRNKDRYFYAQLDFSILLGWTAWAIHSLLDINVEVPATAAIAITMISIIDLATDQAPVSRKIKPLTKFCLLVLSIILLFLSVFRLYGELKLQELNNLCFPSYLIQTNNNHKPSIQDVIKNLYICTNTMPYSPFPWATVGEYAQQHGLWNLSKQCYIEAIKRSPMRASFYFRLAIAQYKLNDLIECQQNLKRAGELFPFKYGSSVELVGK